MGGARAPARKRGYAGGTPALLGSQAYPCKPLAEMAGKSPPKSVEQAGLLAMSV